MHRPASIKCRHAPSRSFPLSMLLLQRLQVLHAAAAHISTVHGLQAACSRGCQWV
jgi:hypothetical protein